jgi:drug/metabolite transporter (DMT)-like permease
MVAQTREGPIFLAKKLGGLLLIILGCLLLVAGMNLESTGLSVLGVLSLIAGVIFWVLKIIRRNENSQVR